MAWGAGEVTAVDRNPAQIRLAGLKVAAAASLDHDDLVGLFSRGRHPDPGELYRRALRPRLGTADRRYWDRWIDIFEIGLHGHNRVGLGVAAAGRALRLVGGRRLVPVIMGVPDARAQGRLYERHFRRRYWNPVTRWLLGRSAVLRSVVVHAGERTAMRDERFHEWLEPGVSRVMGTTLVRENPVWMPVLLGRPVVPEHEMAWLRPGSRPAVRAAAGRIRLVAGSVVDVVEAATAGSLDAVDLSNVPDWLSPNELGRLWGALARALVPGGRLLVRSAYRAAPLPGGEAAEALVRDRAASAELTATERTGLFAAVSLLRRPGGAPPAPR